MEAVSEKADAEGKSMLIKKPKLYLIDIENLIDGLIFTRSIMRLREIIQNSIPVKSDDIVIVGTDITGMSRTITAAWPQAQCLFRRGRDGADHALLRELCLRDLSNFSEVVIASGDHIFAEEAARLLLEGFSVTVLARKGAISRLLRESGAQILEAEDYLPESETIFVDPFIPDYRTTSKNRRRRAKKQYDKTRYNNKRKKEKVLREERGGDYGGEELL